MLMVQSTMRKSRRANEAFRTPIALRFPHQRRGTLDALKACSRAINRSCLDQSRVVCPPVIVYPLLAS